MTSETWRRTICGTRIKPAGEVFAFDGSCATVWQKRRTVYIKSCDNCGKVFQTACKNTKYCSHACSGDGAYLKHREETEQNRPFTPDTVMLCHLYYHARGESIEQIARDFDRSPENVMQALSTPLTQGGMAVVAEEMDLRGKRNRP